MNTSTDIRHRIGAQKRAAQLATGGDPVGLMLGEEQMVELQCALVEVGMPMGSVVSEYDGMKIVRPPGVDGIVIVVKDTFALTNSTSATRHLIGAHPILF